MRTSVAANLADWLFPLWERLRASPALKGVFLFVVSAVLILAGTYVPNTEDSLFAKAERLAFNAQMRLLRERFPRPIENDIVLIGIDEETEKAFPEPLALWHDHLGKLYRGLALAEPHGVAVDIGLPERSFDPLVKGIDKPLMTGIFALKQRTHVVFVQHIGSRGELVPIQDNIAGRLVTSEHLGVDRQIRDVDGAPRRFQEYRAADGTLVPTLVGQMLRLMRRPVDQGFIDYSRGAVIQYVPMHEVVAWFERGDEARLRSAFGGKVVLVGSLTHDRDRWSLPVKLVDLKDEFDSQPGVLIHLQVLRNQLGSGLLHPFSEAVRWLACAFAALAVFVHARPWRVVTGALGVTVALLTLSLVAIRHSQVLLPLASIVLSFTIALFVRLAFDAAESAIERIRLQRSFAGQVSPAVLKEMLRGKLSTGVSAQQADICVLFSDIRDFTALSERMPPGIVTTVLQRYFDRMVHAVHKYDGTVDKFIGDGMMVLFGAPRASSDPCGEAVHCALAMMTELDLLNSEFEHEGLPTLTIGIGVNYGTVTVGNIGSSERHNYSAIGDAVNVAARVEGLTKDLGRKIVITESVASRVEERFHLDPLGEHKLKGHSPVKVWGIRTARTASAAA